MLLSRVKPPVVPVMIYTDIDLSCYILAHIQAGDLLGTDQDKMAELTLRAVIK